MTKLHKIMTLQNIKSQEMADFVGCSRSHIENMRHGRRRPSWEFAEKISAKTAIPIADLMLPKPEISGIPMQDLIATKTTGE
jgi:transcriptional regulator with XRE-family HTH domain